MHTLDFETEKIENKSPTAPIPVGVSIKVDDAPSHYYAWGHPTNNNCSFEDGMIAVGEVMTNPDYEVIMHNAKFDVRVAMEAFNIPILAKIHDTMIMAFLAYPHEESLALKYLAEKYLNMPPDDQANLRDWLVANVKGCTAKNWGAYISYSPGDICAPYAESDTDMTYNLYLALKGYIDETIYG